MTVEVKGVGPIRLIGACTLEDAETLLAALLASPGRGVDWSGCKASHTAVVQVLLAVRPAMTGIPTNIFLRTWIHPLIRGGDIVGV